MKYKLEIYEVTDGTWPLVDTIIRNTPAECLAAADDEYSASEHYHWANPIEYYDTPISQAAAAMGRSRSANKTAAARENGKRGGRPRKSE